MTTTLVDRPVTDAELEQHSPRPATVAEWEYALRRHSLAYDRDDVQADAYECGDALLEALAAGDLREAGRLLFSAKTKTVARRASVELTGRPE